MVSLFNRKFKQQIIKAIRHAEHMTSGEIRVHLKNACGGDALEAAKKVFRRLRMHRTRERNAVLILVALKSKTFAIVGDEGIHRRVGDSFWNDTRDAMKAYFADGRIPEGVVAGIDSVGQKLKKYFPVGSGDSNQLPDTVTRG